VHGLRAQGSKGRGASTAAPLRLKLICNHDGDE
jgi:hypothetical protein